MTAPVAHGYPDWARYSARADKVLADFSDPDIDALEVLGPFFVGDSPCLAVFFTAVTNGFRLAFNFYSDEAGTSYVTSHIFSIAALGRIEQTIPVLGPWMTVTVDPSAVNSSYMTVIATAFTPALQDAGSGSDNILYSVFATNFAVGTTIVNLTDVRPGPSNLYVILPPVLSDVRLYSRNYLGLLVFLTNVVGNGNTAERRIYLPNTTLQLQIINAGGAPAAFTTVLSGQVGHLSAG